MKILAIIPARSGSKSIKNKNIKLISGKPMLAYSIEHALASKLISRVIVSTDSEEYADIAKRHGAEVPFLRPSDLAKDNSTDLETFQHALAYLKDTEDYIPDLCVHLRPTYPIRTISLIDKVIEVLLEKPDYDSVRTVTKVPHTPYKMWSRNQGGKLVPILTLENLDEPWNEPRQKLPEIFVQNANVDVVRTKTITERNSMTGKKIYGMEDDNFFDIDTEKEMAVAINNILSSSTKNYTFCFDIDGVIASITKDNNYELAYPKKGIIFCINKLFELGHHIILFTARGYVTGIDWKETTKNQLKEWNVKYHELKFGKPAADFYIDDKMLAPHFLNLFTN
ncbi:MAG: acylneuraminate cytidylyltransferase family protein [Verrucomicrobiota bacterium]|nr:acylneuraminate cytidylyltransferase family protein [Verrucomicrobiota bacterium]